MVKELHPNYVILEHLEFYISKFSSTMVKELHPNHVILENLECDI